MTLPEDSLHIIALPAFSDNYIWLLEYKQYALVVDPGDAAVVQAYLQAHQLQLCGILLTHHHADHTGGAATLQQAWQCPVYAPDSPHAAYATLETIRLHEGEVLTVPAFADVPFSILELPGHTLDHIAYYCQQQHLFCGDVIFGAGCGRLFEGTPAQMFASLQRIAQLPADTLLYPAHEYTLHNIAFALQVEPDNPALHARQQKTQQLRALGLASLPSRLSLELATNPFLRAGEIAQHTTMQGESPLQVFTRLRAWRNTF